MDVPRDTWPSKSAQRATSQIVFCKTAPWRGFFISGDEQVNPPPLLDISWQERARTRATASGLKSLIVHPPTCEGDESAKTDPNFTK
jgi:hypothetical protein